MYATKKTAQMRLSTITHTRQLLDHDPNPNYVHRERERRTMKAYRKMMRCKMRHVTHRLREIKRPLLETLTPSIERNYMRKAIDKW